MELLKVKTWVLGWVQCSVQTSSTTTAVLTGRVADVGLPPLGVAVQFGEVRADVLMLTSTGPSGPLLCSVFRRVTSTFWLTPISVGGSTSDWVTILVSAWAMTSSESGVEALLLAGRGYYGLGLLGARLLLNVKP